MSTSKRSKRNKGEIFQSDFHIHCLPNLDDGADSPEMSIEMLTRLRAQGIETAAATPHFYPGKESVREFLADRENAFSRLEKQIGDGAPGRDLPRLLLGAEVHLTRGLAGEELKGLVFAGTNHILLELPYASYEPWMAEEIWNIQSAQRLVPVLAHLDRYLAFYREEYLDDLLGIPNLAVQINVEAFDDHRRIRFLWDLADRGLPVVLGSDAHNLTSRPPDFSKAARYFAKKRVAAPLLLHILRSDFLT